MPASADHPTVTLNDPLTLRCGLTLPNRIVKAAMTEALADATQRPVEISPVREATGLGAALLAGITVGHHASVDELATTWKPRATIEPAGVLDRDRWREAVKRSRRLSSTTSAAS